MDQLALRFLIREMPKAELHVHLDGAMRVSTALHLARRQGVNAPTTFAGMAAALTRPAARPTERSLLTRFELPVQLMQDREALGQVTRELITMKAADNVRYLEIKWAPLLHTKGGLNVDEVMGAVCDAAEQASTVYGTAVRLVVVAVRSHPVADNVRLARAAASFRSRGLTGFDLAGSEADDPDPLTHQAAFQAARDGGLAITLHAGDLPDSAALVRRAIALNPARIAHGVGAAVDPELCDELRERGITLDLCPTSNVHSGSVPSLEAHPLASLYRRGVPVTISTDDPTISAVTLSEEFVTACEILGISVADLWAINLWALRASFAEDHIVDRLSREFASWAADIPELAA